MPSPGFFKYAAIVLALSVPNVTRAQGPVTAARAVPLLVSEAACGGCKIRGAASVIANTPRVVEAAGQYVKSNPLPTVQSNSYQPPRQYNQNSGRSANQSDCRRLVPANVGCR